MKEVFLPFLGERKYLQSTTLFDYLIGNYPINGRISYKISDLIYSPHILVTNVEKESSKASLAFGENLEHNLYIYEGSQKEKIVREPYDENKIIEAATFQELLVKWESIADESYMRTVVALNKELHKRYFSLENGQWLFVRMDLKRMPLQRATYKLKLFNYVKTQLTCSQIFENGENLGVIYFSWMLK